jgi:hypothetical protein
MSALQIEIAAAVLYEGILEKFQLFVETLLDTNGFVSV